MAHPTLSRLARSRARLDAVVADLPEQILDHQPAEGWTIRQHMTHLLASEEDHCRVAAVIALGQLDRLPGSIDVDDHNARRLDDQGHRTHAELLAALADQRTRTEDLLKRFSEDELARSGPHPVLGEMTADAIFRILAVHETMHTREIEAILRNLQPPEA